MENESSNGQGISKYIKFLKPHYTIMLQGFIEQLFCILNI